MEATGLQCGAIIDPGAWLVGFVKGTTKQLLHTNYRSSGPCGFSEEDCFSFTHCKSMGDICCHGSYNFDTICFKS